MYILRVYTDHVRLLNVRISDEHRSRWIAEARRLGITVTALVKAAVDERIAAASGDPSILDTRGVDGAHVSVAHGSGIVTAVTVRGGEASVWAGTPAAARALAAALLYQAAAAETLKPCPAVP